MKKMLLAIWLLSLGGGKNNWLSATTAAVDRISTLSLLFPEHPLHWAEIDRFAFTIRLSICGTIGSLFLIILFDAGNWARVLLVISCLVAIVSTVQFYYFLSDLDKKEERKKAHGGDCAPALPITPLLQAVMEGELEKMKEALAAHPEHLNTAYAPNGNMPLHVAALNGYTDIVRLLLEQEGIDTTRTNNDGKTALDLAREKGFAEIVQLLENN